MCERKQLYSLHYLCNYLLNNGTNILKSVEKTSIKKNTKKYVIPFSHSMLLGQRILFSCFQFWFFIWVKWIFFFYSDPNDWTKPTMKYKQRIIPLFVTSTTSLVHIRRSYVKIGVSLYKIMQVTRWYEFMFPILMFRGKRSHLHSLSMKLSSTTCCFAWTQICSCYNREEIKKTVVLPVQKCWWQKI